MQASTYVSVLSLPVCTECVNLSSNEMILSGQLVDQVELVSRVSRAG